jgi:hypothetical protein
VPKLDETAAEDIPVIVPARIVDPDVIEVKVISPVFELLPDMPAI